MTEALASIPAATNVDGPLRLLVTGSRAWLDRHAIQDALWDWLIDHGHTTNKPLSPLPMLVVGDCPTGADAIAEQLWRSWGLPVERYVAQWRRFGNSAGPKRNQQMVNSGANACIAFPKGASRGTRGCLSMAQRAGISTVVIEGHDSYLVNA
jgi:hypothetical protein